MYDAARTADPGGLREALEFAAQALDRTQAWMRTNGVVMDDLNEPWQKVAFSVYTDLAEVSERARHALEDVTPEATAPDRRKPG